MLGLNGKVAFVFGVASEDSIAWAICQSLADAGVTLYLGYQKRFMSRVFQLKDKLPAIAGFIHSTSRPMPIPRNFLKNSRLKTLV